MAKKIILESFKYRFLVTAQNFTSKLDPSDQAGWKQFVREINFVYEKSQAKISWGGNNANSLSVSLKEAEFYVRGDTPRSVDKQKVADMLDKEDPVRIKNDSYFNGLVKQVAELAGYNVLDTQSAHDTRIQTERDFHDAWADSEDVEKIDVLASNQVCTAPEMRWITKRLGNIKGKRLLDVGCGLGEASVYFALIGADVTSSDLSQGMLDATTRLAKANNVTVKQHIASAEDMQLKSEEKFDIIYAGNLLHHVDIEETVARIKPHLAEGGVFVSWDPLHYNPAINIYRAMATDVRTPDEHPLKWADIKMFNKHFSSVETKYYWLTTLVIFVIMSVAQRRSPNKERYWKVVVEEGNRWAWLYKPLEKLDSLLLFIFPPLRLLCWNVVIFCKK